MLPILATYNGGYGLYVEGGAVYATSASNITVTGSKFYNNTADSGGAVFCFNAVLNTYECDFTDNIANWYGGCVYSDSLININSSNFSSNRAKLKGGAVHSTYSGLIETCRLLVDNSVFYNNSAEWGGAIASSNTKSNIIYNSKFYSNNAVYGAVFSRLSKSSLTIVNSSCFNNKALNGTVVYAPSWGRILLNNSNFTDNEGEYGALIYAVQGRIAKSFDDVSMTVVNCKVLDNKVSHSLIFDFSGSILLKNSSFVYNKNQYPCFVVYKIGRHSFNYENIDWGVEEPDLSKLIFVNNTIVLNVSGNSSNLLGDEDCSSNVIQIDENHTVISFRRDSSMEVPIFIDGKGELRQEKFDGTYFLHVLVGCEGWVIGSGGLDGPYRSEKIEAIARIMVQNNEISRKYLDMIYDLKYYYGKAFGHFIIKLPDGRYGIADYFNQSSKGVEIGVLNPGEYMLIPNNYLLHKKGNVSDLSTDDYVSASRYLAGNDLYGVLRTTIQTYDYKKEIVNGQLVSHVDVYLSNDDGHFVGVSSGNLFNDIVSGSRYILGEDIPVIMDGMYLGDYILDTSNLNKTEFIILPVLTVFGNDDYLTVILVDENDNVLGGKDVIVGLNDKNMTFKTDSGGCIQVPTSDLNGGAYIVSVTFKGDENYGEASDFSFIIVDKTDSILSGSSVSAVYNEDKNLIVTLTDSKAGPISGGDVNIILDGQIYLLTSDKNGQVKLSTKTLIPDTYTAVVIFNGDDNYKNSVKITTVTVKKAAVRLTAKKATFKKSKAVKTYKVTLKNSAGKAISKVKLTLKIKGKTYSAVTNSKGTASFKIKKLNTKGTFKSKVAFAGNNLYKSLTRTVQIKIK